MSRTDLTDAYVRGRISRRSFVRGMVALGVSMSAAVAMADTISAAPASKGGFITRNGDVYGGGETVVKLPNTGVADESATSGTAAVVAAGAAAAALVAMRLRKPQVSSDSE